MKDRLTRILREPLLQFLLIGAAIYGAYAIFGPAENAVTERIITVDAGRIDSFISEWERRWKRPPTRQELEGVIDSYVRETLLYEQALVMGLNEDDPITRRRMAQKLEFLTNDLVLLKEPEEGELEQFFAEHEERYRDSDLITFSHVFVDPDARDETTLDDAAQLLVELQAAGEPDAQTLEAGDRFMLESYYPEVSEVDVRRRFGSGFSASLMPLQPGRWHGPILSGYGVHLVYVYAFDQASPPAFDSVRQAVLRDWQLQQQKEFNAEFIAGLKRSYDIEIAEIPAGKILEPELASGRKSADQSSPSADSAPAASESADRVPEPAS